jgi:hypothetical protein
MTSKTRIQILGKSEYSINPGKPRTNPFIDSISIIQNIQGPILFKVRKNAIGKGCS